MSCTSRQRRILCAGWGQLTQHRHQEPPYLDSMELMIAAAREAAARTGMPDICQYLDGVFVVRQLSRSSTDAARELATALGSNAPLLLNSTIGGNSPQTLVNQAAGMIARGEARIILIAGAEKFYPRDQQAARGDQALTDKLLGGPVTDDMIGATELEMDHGLVLPIHGFPLFETAFWADSGKSLDRHLRSLADLWVSFNRVATRNPYAWIQKIIRAEEIMTPSARNRPIAFPYLTFMTSLITVDQAAALIVMADDRAHDAGGQTKLFDSLAGGQSNRPVYFLGGGYTEERQRFLLHRENYLESAALRESVERAFHRSGLTLDDMNAFDIYSCFPCAVENACRSIGLCMDDPRGLTVTGGLGFFGGPGNNYSLHAIASMCDRIACGAIEQGLVTSLGWFLHKHAAGVYGAMPRKRFDEKGDLEDLEQPTVGNAPLSVEEYPAGKGIIETYTVLYDRHAVPSMSIVIGRTERDARFIARAENDKTMIDELTTNCCVARNVNVTPRSDGRKNIVTFPP